TNSRPAASKRWLPWLVVGGISATGAAVFSFICILLLVGLPGNRGIASGVSVADLPIGGKSLDDARTQLVQWAARPVTLTDVDRSCQLSLTDLGVKVDVDGTLAQLKDSPAKSQLQPRMTIDLVQTQNALASLSDQVNIAAVPGNPPQQGRAMDIPVTLSRLQSDATGELSDGVLELDMITVDPPQTDSRGKDSSARTTHVVEKGQEL